MDRMTKLVAGRLKAQSAVGPHPEPELLSAFAENALSEAERGPLLQHLAVCSDCREILYLASPDLPEMQKVLVPQPRAFTFRRWIFGWGALAASIAVAAVFLTTNRFTAHRLENRDQSAHMVAPAPASAPAPQAAATNVPAAANENYTKIAADKAPQELDQLQAARDAMRRQSSKSKLAADMEKNDSRLQPEAKHMTAKPQANLDFDQSGQVRVSAAPVAQGADQIAAVPGPGSRAVNLPQRGQNVGAPTASAGAVVSPAPRAGVIGGMVAGKNAIGYAYSRPDLAKKLTAGSNLSGTILDPSGAVVANAKITVVGPSGEKSATSDPSGEFSFNPLPPGSYSLKAEAPGFKATEIKQVAVLEGKPSALNLRLEVGTVSEAMEVAGAAPAVAETRGASTGAAGASSGYVARQQAAQDFGVVQANAANAQLKDTKVMSGTGSPALQWTISPEGAIEHSANGGKTWQPASVPSGATFRALSAVGGNIWVGGNAGALYHSADFGQSWVKCEPAAGDKKLNQDIVRVDFSDALNGTVNATNGGVWSTSDGGRTWLVK